MSQLNPPVEETPEQKRAAVECIRRFQDAFFWFHNEPELCERYADQYVIIDDRQVAGSGPSADEAREAVRRYFEARGRIMPRESDLIIFIAPHSIWLDELALPSIPPAAPWYPEVEASHLSTGR